MSHLLLLWRQSPGLLIVAVLVNVLAGLSISATMAIFDWGVREPSQWREVCLALLAACAIQFAMQVTSTRLLLKVSLTALLELRLQQCRRILASTQETLQRIGKARLFAVLTHDASTLVNAYHAIIAIMRNLIVICAGMLYLAWISWILAFLTLVLMSFGIILINYFAKAPNRRMTQLRGQVDGLYKYIRDLTEGTKELQLNGKRREYFINNIIVPTAKKISDQSISGLSHFAAVGSFGQSSYFLMVGAMLFLLPQYNGVGPQNVASVALVFLFMSASIGEAINLLPAFGLARASLSRIEQLSNALTQDAEPALGTPYPRDPTEEFILALDDVVYEYSGESDRKFQLGPITLRIHGGEIVFVVGGNGSGKSTLAMLITGLYSATSGDISLNGEQLKDERRQRYRQSFSAIFSDFHLFEHLHEDSYALREQAKGYLKKLSLSHKVSIEGSKFSTIDISAGQRKRLALVSAYLEDRPCYLFDEWAADQDPEFKRFFYRELLPELKSRGKAIIAITHDDLYFDCADRIIKLEDGRAGDVPLNVEVGDGRCWI